MPHPSPEYYYLLQFSTGAPGWVGKRDEQLFNTYDPAKALRFDTKDQALTFINTDYRLPLLFEPTHWRVIHSHWEKIP